MSADQQLDQLYRLIWDEFHELLSELYDIFLLLLEGYLGPDVLQRPSIVLFIFDQYLEIEFMLIFLFCQFHGLIEMLQIFADLDGSLYIKEVAFQAAF